MRFERLDLNLLVALDALLDERSVSLAADRIFLSQSATSSALGRLREYFGDELLVVKGRQMVLTARAEQLVEPVRAVLEQIRTTISVSPPFDPATCDRTLRIMASDYMTEVLLSQVFAIIADEAPLMRFEIQPMAEGPVDSLERGFVDLLLTVDFGMSADHPSQILFGDDYVVIGCANNPAMKGPMTKELYFELGHITSRFGKSRVPAFDDWFMRRQKQQRRIDIVAPSFLSIPGLVAGSQRIATVHRRLADRIADNMNLVVRELPLAMPPIREGAQWHLSNNNDAAIRWFVEKLALVAADEAAKDVKGNVVPIGGTDRSREEAVEQYKVELPPKTRT
jgi:LysR family transcriptional regulator, nod-box dependent transcriptional activator